MNTFEPNEILVSEPTTGGGLVLLLTLTGLVILYSVFKRYGKDFIAVKKNRRVKNIAQDIDTDSDVIPTNMFAGSEEFAAVATVIFMYNRELHDQETTIMTINKVARAYSPWSSKLYFQNQYFNLYRRR
jgi:hypothetical protein